MKRSTRSLTAANLFLLLLVSKYIVPATPYATALQVPLHFQLQFRRGKKKHLPKCVIETKQTTANRKAPPVSFPLRHDTKLLLTQNPSQQAFETVARLQDSDPSQQSRCVRWLTPQQRGQQTVDTLAFQTAVTTWKKNNRTIFLHAQVHVGSTEYYQTYLTDPIFDRSPVLYELLVDEKLLQYEDNNLGRLLQPVRASDTDQSLARQYGWVCQADIIDYARRNWYHADWTRQEYTAKVSTPINPAVEAATALFVGPPLSTNRHLRRRIFSNLFLAGNSFALFLRGILWMAVPSPEVSILLLDWASTWQDDGTKASKGQISPIAQTVLQSIAYGRWQAVRQLVFGQVLIAGHKNMGSSATDPESACLGERNDRALKVIDDAFQVLQTNNVSLLYGCNHCPDLHQKLQAKGFSCQGKEWRTVWSVSIGESVSDSSTNWKAPIAVGGFCYLGIAGVDWISTLQDIFSSQDVASAGIAAFLYLLRRVALYLGMSKFLLDIDEVATNSAN